MHRHRLCCCRVAPQRCWTFRVRPNGLSTDGGARWLAADGSEYTSPSVILSLPPALGAAPFKEMATWRHVAMVFDASTDSIRGYLCVGSGTRLPTHLHSTAVLPTRP